MQMFLKSVLVFILDIDSFYKLFHLLKGNFEVQVNRWLKKKLISYIFSDALVSCNLLKFTMWSLNGTFNFLTSLAKKKKLKFFY